MKLSSTNASAKTDLSYGCIVSRISILVKKFSNFSLLTLEESFTMWLKVCLSKAHNWHYSSAIIDAALGQLYKRANSPNESPGSYFFKNFS